MVSESGSDETALFKSYANLQPLNTELAKQMLKEAKEIMDPLGVPFFLRQGTCLGAVRDQAFIPWDDDIDLGCVIGLNGLTEEMIDPVLAAFRDRGYFVNVESNDRWIAAGMMKSWVRIDLTFFRIIDDSIFHFPMIWMPARLFASLKEIEFIDPGDPHYIAGRQMEEAKSAPTGVAIDRVRTRTVDTHHLGSRWLAQTAES